LGHGWFQALALCIGSSSGGLGMNRTIHGSSPFVYFKVLAGEHQITEKYSIPVIALVHCAIELH
jgi:hypothetical protein